MQYDLRPMFLKQQEDQQQAVVHLVYQIQWVPESSSPHKKVAPKIYSSYRLIAAHIFYTKNGWLILSRQ